MRLDLKRLTYRLCLKAKGFEGLSFLIRKAKQYKKLLNPNLKTQNLIGIIRAYS